MYGMLEGKGSIGQQVAYVPDHCDHVFCRDVEYGFIVGYLEERDSYWVRYWHNLTLGELRTKTNSELTRARHLVPFMIKPQARIEKIMKELGYDGQGGSGETA